MKKCMFFKCKKKVKEDKEYCSPKCVNAAYRFYKKCYKCGASCCGYLCWECYVIPKILRVQIKN